MASAHDCKRNFEWGSRLRAGVSDADGSTTTHLRHGDGYLELWVERDHTGYRESLKNLEFFFFFQIVLIYIFSPVSGCLNRVYTLHMFELINNTSIFYLKKKKLPLFSGCLNKVYTLNTFGLINNTSIFYLKKNNNNNNNNNN